MLKYVKIKTDGTWAVHNWPRDEKAQARRLRDEVASMCNVVHIQDDLLMWVDDEGIPKGLPINEIAWGLGRSGHPIVGDVIVTGPGRPDGSTPGLKAKELDAVVRRIAFHRELTVPF